MGTEVAPDGFVEGGGFEIPDIAQERLSGVYRTIDFSGGKEHPRPPTPVVLQVSTKERQRLAKHKVSPNIRFHYRIIAGALAARAAELLPNDSEELADVVNQAGVWVKDRDENWATAITKSSATLREHADQPRRHCKALFVNQSGPWSSAECAGI